MKALHLSHRASLLRISLCLLIVISLLVVVGTATAELPPRSTTVRASVNSEGNDADGHSYFPALSADGRYVTFNSYASDLVSDDGDINADVFVRDMQTGVTQRVSVDANGGDANSDSFDPVISADGRYVAFYSGASDLVSGDMNGKTDVFIRDMQTGVTQRVSVDANGGDANNISYYPSISADGRYVAFYSGASDLVTGDLNAAYDVFIRDMDTEVTQLVSVDSNDSNSNGASYKPAISADGRHVAFYSDASDLVTGDLAGNRDVFVRDMQTGTTQRVSVDTAGKDGNNDSANPAISADGRYVVFHSSASDLVTDDGNGTWDVFARDMQTGITKRISMDKNGNDANAQSREPAISADGRYVAFDSLASDLVSEDGDSNQDIFVRDTQTGVTQRVSENTLGGDANGWSYFPSISANGAFVAFHSLATGLVTDDADGNFDIFVRNILPTDVTFTPVAGTTRYDTAIKTSQEAFADSTADCVVIATGANWPDALGGAALAAAKNGPILLTAPTALTAGITDEITRLGATEAYILGGTGAVSPTVETALFAKLGAANVHRIWGASRYETAEAIAAATITELEAGAGYDGTAFVATAGNFPDALGASPLAAAKGWPIFLCNPAGDPPTAVMESLGVTKVLILGGTSAISAAQEATLDGVFGAAHVDRLWGTTRYATGVAVATYGVEEAGLVWNGLALSTGANFPDALAGGVLAARNNSVMLLTASTALPADVSDKLTDERDRIAKVYYLGGISAISQSVRDEVEVILD